MSDLTSILQKLLSGTKDGDIDWQESEDEEGQYIATVGENTVGIQESEEEEAEITHYEFMIADRESNRGITFDYFDTTRDQDKLLGDLFRAARDNALDVRGFMARLSDALDDLVNG